MQLGMLEARWRELVAARGPERALTDRATGHAWSFTELAAIADNAEPAWTGAQPGCARLVCPRGGGVGFILEVLRGWRAGAVLCPLEPGQSPPAIPPPTDGICHLKVTSGTTGVGRGVAFTPAQLAADVDQLVNTMGLHPDSPNLSVISLAHSYGFSSLVLPLLCHGIPLILSGGALPAALQQAAQGQPPLTLPAVPALWRTWHEANVIPKTLRLAISAGATLPLPLETAVYSTHGIKLHNFLGSTECGGIAYDPTPAPRTEPAWIGLPISGVRLETTADGRLTVLAPSVATGYWPPGEAPSTRLGNGRFVTNDFAELAPDGGVWLHGRASDVINIAGRKLLPETLETTLLEHPRVADCLVFGLPDASGRGECVGVAVVRRGELAESELRDFVQSRVPAWQVPRRWWWLTELGADARGKRSRRDWRRRLLEADRSP